MDPASVALVIAVILVASTAQTVAGFGFALIAVPLLVTVLDVEDVIVMTSFPAMLNSLLVARTTWQHVPARLVGTMLVASFAGMPFGLLVLLFAPSDALRIAVAASSIVMAAMLIAGARLGARGAPGQALAGATSGVLSTSTGMNGPPIVLYLQDVGLPPPEFRGALSAFFVVSGVTSLSLFAVSGVITGTALALGAPTLPMVIAGNWIGHRLVGLLSEPAFRRLVLLLLIGTAGVSVVTSIVRIVG
jgi:uncharacterized membrane protein YfcA